MSELATEVLKVQSKKFILKRGIPYSVHHFVERHRCAASLGGWRLIEIVQLAVLIDR